MWARFAANPTRPGKSLAKFGLYEGPFLGRILRRLERRSGFALLAWPMSQFPVCRDFAGNFLQSGDWCAEGPSDLAELERVERGNSLLIGAGNLQGSSFPCCPRAGTGACGASAHRNDSIPELSRNSSGPPRRLPPAPVLLRRTGAGGPNGRMAE